MHVASGRDSAEMRRGDDGLVATGVGVDPLLAPQLLDVGATPRREQAHAVPIGHDLVELVERGLHREVLVHVLTNREGRLDCQREPSDDAERSETDGETIHQVGVVISGDLDQVSGGRNELHCANCVARLPFPTPDPCVPVAQAPATEMCGNDARLASAQPRS